MHVHEPAKLVLGRSCHSRWLYRQGGSFDIHVRGTLWGVHVHEPGMLVLGRNGIHTCSFSSVSLQFQKQSWFLHCPWSGITHKGSLMLVGRYM